MKENGTRKEKEVTKGQQQHKGRTNCGEGKEQRRKKKATIKRRQSKKRKEETGRKGGRGTLQSRRARDSSGTMNVAGRAWVGEGGREATGTGKK